ncbi:MAG: hypothetical protein IPJ32_08240 [Sphingobacteriaceae bacterium]|nr:hypothetical protein [Sphingobacteriaceae bacterium]
MINSKKYWVLKTGLLKRIEEEFKKETSKLLKVTATIREQSSKSDIPFCNAGLSYRAQLFVLCPKGFYRKFYYKKVKKFKEPKTLF